MPQTRQEVLDQITQCGAMSYAEWVRFVNSIVFILDESGGGGLVSSIRTPVIITDGMPITITWLTDIIPDSDPAITYFQKHSSYPTIDEENKNDDGSWSPNAAASYSWNAARTILTLTPQTIYTNFIII